MTHGVKPVLPFNIMMATFLIPDIDELLATNDLLAIQVCQLEKHLVDLTSIHNCILTSCFASTCQFKKHYTNTIHIYNFKPGALVLVRSARSDMDKTRPHYYGPMVILRCTHNRAYRLGELDKSILRLCYAAFQLIPYYSHSSSCFTVTYIVDSESLASLKQEDTLPAGRTNNYNNTLT